MELRHALAQLSEIHEQLARTQTFRGYRSITVAFSGLVGVIVAVAQALWLPQPAESINAYLALWVGAAAINVTVVGVEIFSRARVSEMSWTRRATMVAIEQFLPSLIVGALLTTVVAVRAPQAIWMLPGLWALVFSLGIFASCRLLPRPAWLAGAWYLFCGIVALGWGSGEYALSPWIMGISFGGGQLLTAAILHITLERPPTELH